MARKKTPRHPVGIVCAEQDRSFLDNLSTRLKKEAELKLLPTRFVPGAPAVFDGAPDDSLADARVVVVLLSPWLLATDWAFSEEATQMLQRVEDGGQQLVLALVRACNPAGTPLSEHPISPAVDRPLEEFPAANEWKKIIRAVNSAARSTRRRRRRASTTQTLARIPVYDDEEHRRLGERLEALYACDDEDCDPFIDEVSDALRRGPQLRPGEILHGRYRLLEQIGGEGVAASFRAWDREVSQLVVVRVLQFPSEAERFWAAANAIADLDHPGVVRVRRRRGSWRGFDYFVTDAPEGGTLADAFGSMSSGELLVSLFEAAHALGYAHDNGVLHLDMRPGVIYQSREGASWLSDFGLGLHGPGSLYTAPEALAADWVPDTRADVYSLGMTLLAVLHGGPLPVTVLRGAEPLIDGLTNPDATDTVRAALRTAVSWDLDTRFESVPAFLDAMHADHALVGKLARTANLCGRHRLAADYYRLLLERGDNAVRIPLARSLTELGAAAEAFATLIEALDDPDIDAAATEGVLAELSHLSRATDEWAPLIDALERRAETAGAAQRADLLLKVAELRDAHSPEGERIAAWEAVLEHHQKRAQARQALIALTDSFPDADPEAVTGWLLQRVSYAPDDEAKAPLYARLGRRYLDEHNDERSGLFWLERAAGAGARDPEVARTLEQIRSSRGEWGQVVDLMEEQARDMTDGDGVPLLLKAARLARYATRDADRAAGLYEAVLNRDDDHVEALRFLARHRYATGQISNAIELYRRLASSEVEDQLGLALALLDADRADEALRNLEAALTRAPHHAGLLEVTAHQQLEAGHWDKASELYARLAADSMGDTRADALLAGGDVAWIDGRFEDAAGLYHEALEVRPNDQHAWWGLAKVARTAEAATDSQPWLIATPRLFTPEEALARLLTGLLDPAAVRAWLELDLHGWAVQDNFLDEEPFRLAAAAVDVMQRRGIAGPSLFQRLRDSFPRAGARIDAVARLWTTPAGDEPPLTMQQAYRWSRLGTDFDPDVPREVVHCEPPVAKDPVPSFRPSLNALRAQVAWNVLLKGELTDEELPDSADPTDLGTPRDDRPAAAALLSADGLLHPLPEGTRLWVGGGQTDDVKLPELEPGWCTLYRHGKRVYVTDKSSNGVTVDGVPVTEARLVGGEELTFGDHHFRFVMGSNAVPVPALAEDIGEPDFTEDVPIEEVEPDSITQDQDEPTDEGLGSPPVPIPDGARIALLYNDGSRERLVPFTGESLSIGTRKGDDVRVALERGGLLFRLRRNGALVEVTDKKGSQSHLSPGDELFAADHRWRLVILDDSEPDARVPVLVYDDGTLDGLTIPLEPEETTLGRGRANHIHINKGVRVSRTHCSIVSKDGNHVVVDRESSNGTFVNGEMVTNKALKPGDVLQVGDASFRFTLVEEMPKHDPLRVLEVFSAPLEDLDELDHTEIIPLSALREQPISIDDGLHKIAIANNALRVVMQTLDKKTGHGRGKARVQLILDGAPGRFQPLFDSVRVRSGGLPDMQILFNVAQRPEPEQRHLLNTGLVDLIERAVSVACDTLPEDEVDGLLQHVAQVNYREHLRL